MAGIFCMASVGANAQTNARVLGTDISYWNCGTSATGISQANWNTAYSSGNMRYAIFRATRGGTTGVDQPQGTPGGGSQSTLSRRYDDSRFIQNLNRAVAAGIFSGSYHFGRPDIIASTPDTGGIANTGTDEANHFIQMAGAWMRPGYLLPVFDLEAGQSQRTANEIAQFCVDFSDRIYAVMQIRPGMYINGSYSGTLQNSSQSLRDQLAKPPTFTPSAIAPAYPLLWDARYGVGAISQTDENYNINDVPIHTGSPQNNGSHNSSYYGPWDDYGKLQPWTFWQYASVASIPGLNAVDSGVDINVSQGDIEYIKNYLVPAVWWHNNSGDWSTLTNWNGGQPIVAPISSPGQATPYTNGPLPTPRLPGASGSGVTSGQHDTVILERPSANITVTLSTGTHNIRKLYMRETLHITGGALAINYDPTYRADNLANVLHGGPLSAQFSGPVTMSNGTLVVHTLQVDTNRTLTLAGGTMTFNKINLMPHNSLPAKIVVNGNVNLGPLQNAAATIAKGSGTGTSSFIDLGGGTRTITVGNGTNEVDLSIEVPVTNGGLVKAGAGTMRVTIHNIYSAGTTVSAGRLFVNNGAGSGTGSGSVTVNGGILGGTGIISGAVTVNAGGTVAPGLSIGNLTLNSAPTLNGTLVIEINRNGGATLADKLVLTSGTLNYGGTLVVTNIGATLVGGETFTNFAAGSYSGAFANTVLPPLANGLNWYLGHLTTNGTIKVNRQPTVNSVSVTNNFPGTLQIPIATLVSAGSDADSDALSLSGFGVSTNGVTLTSDGTHLNYSSGVNVADKFNFIISDGRGGTATNSMAIAPSTVVTGAFTQSPTANGDSVQLHFSGTPGATYYLDRSTNLPSWITIWTNVAPPSGMFDYTDEFDDLSEPPAQSFYRLRW